MTAAAISEELRVYARRRWPTGNDKYHKSVLRSLLGLTQRRIRSFWEGEASAVPRGTEVANIEKLIGKKIGAAADEEASNAADRALEARFAALETEVADLRAALARATLAAEGRVARGSRGSSHDIGAGHPRRRSTD